MRPTLMSQGYRCDLTCYKVWHISINSVRADLPDRRSYPAVVAEAPVGCSAMMLPCLEYAEVTIYKHDVLNSHFMRVIVVTHLEQSPYLCNFCRENKPIRELTWHIVAFGSLVWGCVICTLWRVSASTMIMYMDSASRHPGYIAAR